MHVGGYIEEGTTTTPFDMVVLNELDRFHLALEGIRRVPGLFERVTAATDAFTGKIAAHRRYIREHGEDMPEIRNWGWSFDPCDRFEGQAPGPASSIARR